MSTSLKCRNCGSSEIEEDNARGDRVCTACGSVVEGTLIVSEIQFEDAAVIGQFVSAESGGGATSFGKFQMGGVYESREVTVRKAKKEITNLCNQLQMNQCHIDTSLNYFKMALMRSLTRGRKSTHIHAACVYMTCRTEKTTHLLVDISDIQQICSFELGRTYLRLSQALCISIPTIDPCLYIMRFANRLELGNKTHEVSMTALRIVQRMKKDFMHSGRRPTGLCAAALLIAARMHDFSRTINDIISVVKIHESTLRKRLTEFADTPSSALTLEEFMTVDLEYEHDPPSFKAARMKDRERLKDFGETELTDLQKEIEELLEREHDKRCKTTINRYISNSNESRIEDEIELETAAFIQKSNMEAIKFCMEGEINCTDNMKKISETLMDGLRPDIEAICRITQNDLDDIACDEVTDKIENYNSWCDDEEIKDFLLTDEEANLKEILWKQLNSDFLKSCKDREERLAKEQEDSKPEKKRRRSRKKLIGPSSSVGEAIEKMLQEKKISNKINYDILRKLTDSMTELTENANEMETEMSLEDDKSTNSHKEPLYTESCSPAKKTKFEVSFPVAEEVPSSSNMLLPVVEEYNLADEEDEDDELDNDADGELEPESLKALLDKGAGDDDEFYGYDEDDY